MKKNDNLSYAQSQIIDATLKLMEEQSFESITVTEIVNEAEVGRASFYRNFTSKEDVLNQHIYRLIKTWYKDFEGKTDPSWIPSLLWHFYNNKNLYSLLFKSNLSSLVFESIKSINSPKEDQDNIHAYFNAAVCGAVLGWVEEWFSMGLKETPDEIMDLLKQAMLMAKQTAK